MNKKKLRVRDHSLMELEKNTTETFAKTIYSNYINFDKYELAIIIQNCRMSCQSLLHLQFYLNNTKV